MVDGGQKAGVVYDINSMYPHLLTVIDLITRRGKYKTVSKLNSKTFIKYSDVILMIFRFEYSNIQIRWIGRAHMNSV